MLLDLVRQARLPGDGESRGHLHGGSARLQVLDRIGAGEDAARRNDRNIQIFLFEKGERFSHDGLQALRLPVVWAEAEMATGQRTFDHNVVWRPLQTHGSFQEDREGSHRRDDDAELDVTEPFVLADKIEASQMESGGQRDAVDSRFHGCLHAHLECRGGVVHRKLLHAIHEDRSIACFLTDGMGYKPLLSFGELFQIEMHRRFVAIVDVRRIHLALVGYV